jgi:dTDP-4-dehydrorhamnose reductase
MRIVVTGREGQVAQSLAEAGGAAGHEIVRLGRPELDLMRPDGIAAAISAAAPDIVVSAAAYTAVDKAESEPDEAFAVNAVGAGAVAEAAHRLGVPIVHLSTDYVFDGTKPTPYLESDAVGPVSVYGASKLEGERRVGAVPNHAILRTAWVYSPFGRNFVKTMVALGAERGEVRVVADQRGTPTSAADIAQALLAVAKTMTGSNDPALRGVFHLAGSGEASWADFAEAIFADLVRQGRAPVAVRRIVTAEYPTPARRPANSRLDCTKLLEAHGVRLPVWQDSLAICIDRLISGASRSTASHPS